MPCVERPIRRPNTNIPNENEKESNEKSTEPKTIAPFIASARGRHTMVTIYGGLW